MRFAYFYIMVDSPNLGGPRVRYRHTVQAKDISVERLPRLHGPAAFG
jgi:hypothetical protein